MNRDRAPGGPNSQQESSRALQFSDKCSASPDSSQLQQGPPPTPPRVCHTSTSISPSPGRSHNGFSWPLFPTGVGVVVSRVQVRAGPGRGDETRSNWAHGALKGILYSVALRLECRLLPLMRQGRALVVLRSLAHISLRISSSYGISATETFGSEI